MSQANPEETEEEKEARIKDIQEILERNKCEVCGKPDPTTFLTSGTDRICTPCVRGRHRIAVGRGTKADYAREAAYESKDREQG